MLGMTILTYSLKGIQMYKISKFLKQANTFHYMTGNLIPSQITCKLEIVKSTGKFPVS